MSIKVLNLVQGICKRPKMYTKRGRPKDVLLILMGAWLATRPYDKEPCNPELHVPLKKLVDRYDPVRCWGRLGGHFDPDEILKNIKKEGHKTDEEIFNRIIEIVDEEA